MCRSTVYMSTMEGVLELVNNAVRLNLEDDLLIIIDDAGERLELNNVRIKEVNLISNNIVLEKKAQTGQ
jgi:predicted RNA-binding protein